ncbi:hypothetical protein LY76DRAFT_608944 [Colletotrichum caudatum]|nr:hypothetical protein LY76DRAFT_608944 [Colletotrichum caudatum]
MATGGPSFGINPRPPRSLTPTATESILSAQKQGQEEEEKEEEEVADKDIAALYGSPQTPQKQRSPSTLVVHPPPGTVLENGETLRPEDSVSQLGARKTALRCVVEGHKDRVSEEAQLGKYAATTVFLLLLLLLLLFSSIPDDHRQ